MARYSAVTDRSTMTTSAVKTLLGISDSSKDALITHWLAALKAEADELTANPFHERDWDEDSDTYLEIKDPAVELDIPADLEHAIFARVAAEVARLDGQNRPGRKPVQAKSAGGWAKTRSSSVNAMKEAQQTWDAAILRHRLIPGV